MTEQEFLTRTTDREARQWYKSRPPNVKRAVLQYPPLFKYRLKTTGQICCLYAFTEDTEKKTCEECQIVILEGYHKNHIIFGVKLKDLEKIEK